MAPFRASDLCTYCFDLPNIERELSKLQIEACKRGEEKSDDPETMLTFTCFSDFQFEKLYHFLTERRRIHRHQNIATRQRANHNARVKLVADGRDPNRVIVMIDFKQNMGACNRLLLIRHDSSTRLKFI